MKVAIITLHGYFNYGNRLQNYALVKTIQKMGHEVETLVVKSDYRQMSLSERILLNRTIRDYIRIPARIITKLVYDKQLRIKGIKLESFSHKYLNEIFVEHKELENLSNNYDYFVAGSDQIWNENYKMDYYFLNFSPKDKNIAYAASIANEVISEEYRSYLKKMLRHFKAISVREKLAQDMILDLEEFKPILTLDPTLLLDYKGWNEIAKQSELQDKENYLLTYFLGDAPTKEIMRIAKDYNLNVFNLYNPKNIHYLSASLEDFLKLFSQASMVLTDSFHGTLFSLIYEKRFVVLPRGEMNSRLNSILNLVGLEDRFGDITIINKEIDYEHTKRILSSEKKNSLDFLDNNLK